MAGRPDDGSEPLLPGRLGVLRRWDAAQHVGPAMSGGLRPGRRYGRVLPRIDERRPDGDPRQEMDRRGSRVGTTKPTVAARKSARRAKAKRTRR